MTDLEKQGLEYSRRQKRRAFGTWIARQSAAAARHKKAASLQGAPPINTGLQPGEVRKPQT